jgi:hypothetical protein
VTFPSTLVHHNIVKFIYFGCGLINTTGTIAEQLDKVWVNFMMLGRFAICCSAWQISTCCR